MIEGLLRLLKMPNLAPLVGSRRITTSGQLEVPFVVEEGGQAITVATSAVEPPRLGRLVLRHALEVALQLTALSEEPVLAGLMAARTAALFGELEGVDLPPALRAWSSSAPPDRDAVRARWPALAQLQASASATLPDGLEKRLEQVWSLLGPAEYLMGLGGDERIRLDPRTRLNAYGCSPSPRPWAVTFASSTASSISERGYARAEAARLRWLQETLASDLAPCQQAATESVRAGLRAFYGLERSVEVVITPSGTDGELGALALALLADPQSAWTNLLVAPEESGAGVPLAARGKHFAAQTARGVAIPQREGIAGFPGNIEMATVAARTAEGDLRPSNQVDADCARVVDGALGASRRVLLHVLDQSKTGLLLPGNAEALRELSPGRVEVLVDASQARLSPASVQRYLSRGFIVLVTGSKFFTGPPFAGALLVPPAVATRLKGSRLLPEGLRDYWGRFDWPSEAPACAALPEEANLGVVLRWEAALAEMEAFGAVDDSVAQAVLTEFISRVSQGIAAAPALRLLETDQLPRQAPRTWDGCPTILAFSTWVPNGEGGDRPLTTEESRQVFRWLNANLEGVLPGSATIAERELARRRFHIGQPLAVGTPRGPAGALRICAGARLVSGEPSQAGLGLRDRLDREIGDALAILDKIALILRHRTELQKLDPQPEL